MNFFSFFAFRCNFFLKRKIFSGSRPVFSANASGMAIRFSVLAVLFCKRFFLSLNQHTTGRAPLLNGHYPASTRLRARPTPHRQSVRFILPRPFSSHDLRSMGASKFRVQLSPRAIRYHPEEPYRCTHLSLPCSCRLHHSREAGHSRFRSLHFDSLTK